MEVIIPKCPGLDFVFENATGQKNLDRKKEIKKKLFQHSGVTLWKRTSISVAQTSSVCIIVLKCGIIKNFVSLLVLCSFSTTYLGVENQDKPWSHFVESYRISWWFYRPLSRMYASRGLFRAQELR